MIIRVFSVSHHQNSLRVLCTWDIVLAVLSPLNLFMPPLNPLENVLSQGWYFSGISKSEGVLSPE